MYVFTVAGCPN